MSDTPDLKPCPFCGGEVELLSNIVSCMHCLCALPDGYGYEGENIGFHTEGEAIAAWNTRAVDPAAIREAALREAADVAEALAVKWWKEYKDRLSPHCADPHYQGKSDGAEDVAAAILELIGEKK